MSRGTGFALLLAASVACYCVLSFYQTTAAQQRTGGDPPFANSVELRLDMVTQLKEIKELLKEQNALLRSGGLRVVVTLPEKPDKR
jgi:hypothetical protein